MPARSRRGLLAVTGLPCHRSLAIGQAHGLWPAIRNGDDSVVLGGPTVALEDAAMEATRLGARCTRLAVAVASHTPLMQVAVARVGAWLDTTPRRRPATPLFANLGGERVRDADHARQALAGQIASTVAWDDCMDALHARQPRCVLEMGAGQALARLWNQRHPEVPARASDEFRSAEGVVAWVRRQLGD